MEVQQMHKFWETFDVVYHLFWIIPNVWDARSLACTSKFLRDTSYPRTWNHMWIPDDLPKNPLSEDGGKAKFAAIKRHGDQVRSVSISDLYQLHISSRIFEAPYEHYLFPRLQKLDVHYAGSDYLLDRFLPKTLTELKITLESGPHFRPEVTRLVSSAKNLEKLGTFSLIRGTPGLEEGVAVREFQDFIENLPNQSKLKSFTIKDCTTTATLARRVARLPGLLKLSLDLRFIKPDPKDCRGPVPPASTAIDTLHNMRSVELEELDFSVGPDLPFTLAPLARFPMLNDLTILVYGARSPLSLEPLLQLSLLNRVHVDVPDMGALVTVDLFNAFLQAWTHIRRLRLIDSRRDFGWFFPKRALLPTAALGMVGVHAPQLESLEIQVDPTCPPALPAPEKPFPAGSNLYIHWEDSDEDHLIHLEAYLLLLCGTLGSYGGSDFGTLWRNHPSGRVHGRPECR